MTVNKKVAVIYVPVIHQGYVSFIKKLKDHGVSQIYVVSDEILGLHEELDYINRKDRIRALSHEDIKKHLALITSIPILLLTTQSILELQQERASLVMPREDINRFIAETYFGGHSILYENVFLRINRENTGEEKIPNTEKIVFSDFEKTLINQAVKESEKSADWWRQVGAVLVKDSVIVSKAYNEHMPEHELPNMYGDARSLFRKGMNIHYVTTAHAEVALIGDAARKGISTEGAEVFITDFPCPYCARLFAKAGIKKIYYLKGYAVLDGDDFFKHMGIETVKVDIPE